MIQIHFITGMDIAFLFCNKYSNKRIINWIALNRQCDFTVLFFIINAIINTSKY